MIIVLSQKEPSIFIIIRYVFKYAENIYDNIKQIPTLKKTRGLPELLVFPFSHYSLLILSTFMYHKPVLFLQLKIEDTEECNEN